MSRVIETNIMHNLIKEAAKKLTSAGVDSANLDARLLLMHVLGASREELMLRPDRELTAAEQQQFEELIARRVNREPLSHILGVREFYGREFEVSGDVLDPRPDTETLIDSVLKYYQAVVGKQSESVGEPALSPIPSASQEASAEMNILDIGTGSGCIIITLLKEIEHIQGVALDVSKAALAVAKRNASTHQLGNRLRFVEGSLFNLDSNISGLGGKCFDVIVSNPPYISASDMATLMPEVHEYEPHLALHGGKDGLDCYESLAKSLGQLLKTNGLVFLEIGAGQRDDVAGIFSAHNWQLVAVHRDLAGHERCVIFKQEK